MGIDQEKRKISWVSWRKFVSRRATNFLGIKHIKIFNVALMALWVRVIQSKYGGGKES